MDIGLHNCHCEERNDEAILNKQQLHNNLDKITSLRSQWHFFVTNISLNIPDVIIYY